MIKEAIERIESMTNDKRDVLEPTVEIKERLYWSENHHPVAEPTVDAISVMTLAGLVEYGARLGMPESEFSHFHVIDPTRVVLQGKLREPWLDCNLYAAAVPPRRGSFPFGQWLDQESFMIQAQACFVKSNGDLDEMLKTIGTLKAGAATTFDDDGVTQQVTATAGIERVKGLALPNPVRLAPYRTFGEIYQPSSDFILRVSGGSESQVPTIGLYEVVSNDWIGQACESIKEKLAELLEEEGGQISQVPIIV